VHRLGFRYAVGDGVGPPACEVLRRSGAAAPKREKKTKCDNTSCELAYSLVAIFAGKMPLNHNGVGFSAGTGFGVAG
jgi:hypothetical protein